MKNYKTIFIIVFFLVVTSVYVPFLTHQDTLASTANIDPRDPAFMSQEEWEQIQQQLAAEEAERQAEQLKIQQQQELLEQKQAACQSGELFDQATESCRPATCPDGTVSVQCLPPLETQQLVQQDVGQQVSEDQKINEETNQTTEEIVTEDTGSEVSSN
ncbi:hypothetical protein [Candidatus Nitrosocosmicus franklandus]|uniref:Uncharacterized protein n=1 Tax=Candidatus Nitrosocosmicus franklandianus TaxID=1798806 RepID=A0A484I918_9ARCH|nr:hypothetical protein [Candidatus Nitrosocosmicus franklandus]VFJ13312.1 protein of unknown function [Candidatus Nitrosocosmicus franklandus]